MDPNDDGQCPQWQSSLFGQICFPLPGSCEHGNEIRIPYMVPNLTIWGTVKFSSTILHHGVTAVNEDNTTLFYTWQPFRSISRAARKKLWFTHQIFEICLHCTAITNRVLKDNWCCFFTFSVGIATKLPDGRTNNLGSFPGTRNGTVFFFSSLQYLKLLLRRPANEYSSKQSSALLIVL